MASDGETWCANDPNFAVIYSFLKVFGKLYGLEVPSIAKLQEFIENTQEVSEALKELHLKLLRRALKSVHSNRWEKGMIKFCHQQGHHQEAWEIERFSYKKASTQVKLKVLKILLEYQFTCHPKFKSAVNAISCKELRLDPIGRDQNGCAYWLQTDDDANLCLYKEDQDEETWQLIARNREELVKVIGQLKSGEEISPSQTSNANEDNSSGAENPIQELHSKTELQSEKPQAEDEENDEEFLSPESESEQEIDPEQKEQQSSDAFDGNETNAESTDPLDSNDTKKEISDTPVSNEQANENEAVSCTKEIITEKQSKSITEKQVVNVTEQFKEEIVQKSPSICENQDKENKDMPEKCSLSLLENQSEDRIETNQNDPENQSEDTIETNPNAIKTQSETNDNLKVSETENNSTEHIIEKEFSDEAPNSPRLSECSIDSESILEDEDDSTANKEVKNEENNVQNDEVSEAIEEPVMLVTGEGNGADCESYFIGEEISDPVMYFYGEGCGYDNDTGNPEAIEETNQAESEENGNEEVVNGEHAIVNTKSKLSKSVRLKTVNKRSLKKQSNDTNDTKLDTKKPCVRDTDKSNNSDKDNDLKREASVNDKSTTDSESPRKNKVKKGRSKVKKKAVRRKLKIKTNGEKESINSVSVTDNCQDKTSIIEKRKSSVSSVDQDEDPKTEKENTPDKELKIEDPLPTKKLRLETTPESDVNATHSKDAVSDSIENKDNRNPDVIFKRKKIKASKGKFKRKSTSQKIQELDKNNDVDKMNDSSKQVNKSLKRSLIEEPTSDKNKTESQSESEDDEPITSGKRLKIKPKKIMTSSRKKVEAKLMEKHSSDESEEETLYSLAGKKSAKKLVKKKPKGKSKDKDKNPKAKLEKPNSDESDSAPVRQSRRIAQQKIKEEAERRHQEEVALREMKMIHKKKGKDDEDEEEWRASGRSSSEAESKRKPRNTWRASDSTGPEPDSESDSPLFELQPDPEPEHDYGKSDHEFSPESDLESGEAAEPLKRARTLQEEKDSGFCKRCSSGEQPEWILLCDACDAGYHASCLKPMLFVVPEGDWFCPPCNHDKLIKALESELIKYDELLAKVEEERARKKLEEPEPKEEEKKGKQEPDSEGSDSSWSSSSEDAAVYRLRARRQLPVSYRSQEYDRIISAAIKEEYVEPTTSAGNQGRGKDISTIIEAAEEEKMKAEREAIEQGKPVELSKKLKKKQRRKPRKLNSLEVPSEDDDETDEDFKDTGGASTSEDISSSADKESSDSRSSDSLPIRRTGRSENKKDRPKMTESSPENKKKKRGVFEDSSSESAGAKEWNASLKSKSKSHSRPKKRDKRDKSRRSRKSRGLTQYDAEGNVIRARVTYGGLSGGEGENDWSPKHRTRQKKINYTEMPNTESEDEMHKSSGKHMPDSSDEFKCSDSDLDTDSDSERTKKRKEEENAERERALSDLVKKTAVVPLEKLPEDVTKAKTEELQAHLNAQAATTRPQRGKGSRGGRGSRGPRGRGGARGGRGSSPQTDDALAKLVGVKIKELGQDGSPIKASQLEREKKRQEREAKQAEKEAKKMERLQKREEKEKLKEQKAKEREEKRLARLALQESKRIKKEKEYMSPMGGYGMAGTPIGEAPRVNNMNMNMNMNMFNHMRPQRPVGPGLQGPHGPGGQGPGQALPGAPSGPGDGPEQRFPNTPRLQVRAELRGVLTGEERLAARAAHLAREGAYSADGTLSVAGSPQPFKPVSEEPSIITRMPHMLNQQYRGPVMYGGYGRPASMFGAARGFPPHYYRGPPAYPAPPPGASAAPPPTAAPLYRPHLPGPGGAGTPMHHNQAPLHHSGGYYRSTPPQVATPPGAPGPHATPPQHSMAGPQNTPFLARSPGPNVSPAVSGAPVMGTPGAPLISRPQVLGAGPLSMPPGPSRLLGPPGQSPVPPGGPIAQPPASQEQESPIRIKAEVKTEPEYRSPVASPGAASPGEIREEPPRHPKIKVTEVRERRPRFPLGPYAPHLAPYRPYAAPPLHAAPPHSVAPPHYSAPSTHHGAVPPHHEAAPPHHGAAPPHHVGTPPHHGAAPPHHVGAPPHHVTPPPHGGAPTSLHGAVPPHHSAPPPHHPSPHPLQIRDAQYMQERARSPAGSEARPYAPRLFPGGMRMPPPHPPPPQYRPPLHATQSSPHGQHSQSPHGQHPQSSHGQQSQSLHGQQSQSPHGQNPQQVSHGQHQQASHGIHPQQVPQGQHSQQVPHGQHSQVPHGQHSQVPHGQHPQQVPHGQHPQVPHGQHPQVLHGQHPQHVPHGQHPQQASHGQHSQSLHGQPSQSPHRQHSQSPHSQHPQVSLGQHSQSSLSHGQSPQLHGPHPQSHGQHPQSHGHPQSPHGQLSASPHGQLSASPHGQLSASPHRQLSASPHRQISSPHAVPQPPQTKSPHTLLPHAQPQSPLTAHAQPSRSPHLSQTHPTGRGTVVFPPQMQASPRAASPPLSPRRLQSLQPAPSPGAESPPPPPLDRIKVEREEGSVFGGLVSYFSSQHEDDMDG